MYPNQASLAQEVKREVLAELQGGGLGPGGGPANRFASPPAAGRTYQTVKDSVKNEVMAEIQAQQLDKMAQVYGLDRPLADQRIQQMIDERLRSVDNLKAAIRKELLALQELETQQAGGDPFIRQTALALAEEAHRQGIPQEQLLQRLGRRTTGGSGFTGRLSNFINVGQRRGFLCGVGVMVLCHLLFPASRKNMHSVAVRSMEEGMAIVDRAKSFVRSRHPQSPLKDPPAPSPTPDPPPEGYQPPEGEN